MIKYIRVQPNDNVATVTQTMPAGGVLSVDGQEVHLADEIPFGHKFALDPIAKGGTVVRYGYPIGKASRDIGAGEWVHSHNLETGLSGLLEYTFNPSEEEKHQKDNSYRKTFQGYERADGSVGVRNELWILPTVSCVNATANTLAEMARKQFGHLCDGIYALPHNAGCSQLGDDHQRTQQLLADIVRHPNAGGVLLLSLGCENNNLSYFRPVLGEVDERRVKFLVAQDVDDEYREGLRLVGEIAGVLSGDKRSECPVEKLAIGFKCGGSDAFSGVTANPLCGKIADRITGSGGIGILTEVPEMFGAEQILMDRADSRETFDKVVELVNSFKQYYMDYNQPIYENPAPGNKEGGITTLEEKSLGCIQKGGHATVTGTLDYGEKASKPGLNLLTGPGNDSVSITNLLCAGAQIILFTTGRGNPLGTAIPSIKISSNSDLFRRKSNWIDFNAGELLEGRDVEETADALWELVLDIASGVKEARNERNGQREIMIFKDGVLL